MKFTIINEHGEEYANDPTFTGEEEFDADNITPLLSAKDEFYNTETRDLPYGRQRAIEFLKLCDFHEVPEYKK